MATVVRVDGFRFAIYANDHGPAHVHVYDGDGMARIAIGGIGTRPMVLSVVRMSDVDARRVCRIVERNQGLLTVAWRRIHGT